MSLSFRVGKGRSSGNQFMGRGLLAGFLDIFRRRELIEVKSFITKYIEVDSFITKSVEVNSKITKYIEIDSKINIVDI